MSRRPPEPCFTLRGHGSPVSAINFILVEGSWYLLSASNGGDVFLWDLATYRTVTRMLAIHVDKVLWLSHGLDIESKTFFFSQSKDGIINCYRNELEARLTFKVTYSFATRSASFCCCDLYVDYKGADNSVKHLIAFPCNSSTQVMTRDVKSGKCLNTLNTAADCESKSKYGIIMTLKLVDIRSLWQPIQQKSNIGLFLGHENGAVVGWNITLSEDTSGCKVAVKMCQINCFEEMITCLDFDPTIKRGVCGSPTAHLCFWELKESKEMYQNPTTCELITSKRVELTNPGISCLKIRPDLKILVTGGWDSRLRLFSWKTLKPLAVLDFHKESIESVAFSPEPIDRFNGYLLASGSKEGSISLWSIFNEKYVVKNVY